MELFDAVVVGAGPAGSTLSRTLARNGLKTLLVEKELPGSRRVCGGFAGPEMTGFFESVGLSAQFEALPKNVIRRVRISGTRFGPVDASFPRGPGWSVDRALFDEWLAREAVAEGASLSCRSTVVSARKTSGMWRVTVENGKAVRDVSSRFFIAATGRRPPRPSPGKRFFFACKAVYAGARTQWDEVTLHFVPNGHVGLNPIGTVDLSKMPLVPREFYCDTDKGKVNKYDILICKDGALTGKTCFVDIDFPIEEVMVNEHIYLIRTKKELANQKFFSYLIASDFIQRQIKDLAYRKKGQPGLNLDHIKRIKVPSIPKLDQDKVAEKIEPIEQKINSLSSKIRNPQEAINRVFSREFKFDLDKIYEFEKINFLSVCDTLSYRNKQIRSSYRWHKLQEIQKLLYENNPHILRLGKHIRSTQNGWSPNCNETATDHGVLGIDALSVETALRFDNLKFTNEYKNNIKDFIVEENDFLISRGNTVDLVALASIANSVKEDIDIIFPDLLIRIDFDETTINKRYMAYLFNSVIGRLYFKYSTKGKNQTMVKVSAEELDNFFLPIPSPKLQQKIVEEINSELSQREVLKQNIEKERDQIDLIVKAAIS